MNLRRRFLQSASFLAGILLLVASSRAPAQRPNPTSPGHHETLPTPLSAEQVKSALERFSKGGPNLPPELLDFFKEKMERDGKKVDEQQLKNALEMMQKNPDLRRQVEEMGRKLRNNGGKNKLTTEERQQLERLAPQLDKMVPPNGGPNNPMPPKNLDPPMLPKNDLKFPDGAAPPPLPNQLPPPPFDPNPRPNPFEPNETPRDKAAHAAASLWERNIGPLDETPAVKRALFELVDGTDDLRDSDGKSFWDTIAKETGESTSFSELLDGASGAESWSLPKFDLPSFDWGSSDSGGDSGGAGSSPPRESWWKRLTSDRNPASSSSPRAPSSGFSGFNIGVPGLEGGWLVVVILGAIVLASLVWRFWEVKRARARAAARGLGGPGWPVDPRRITTREHVVLAFEYLSVLICGPTAKTWTHNTIAEALSELAATHGETAVMLARLYELARYAPLNEPLSTAELAEARRLVCSLAGLEHE